MNNEFDLVICVGPNDNDIVEYMLSFNKKILLVIEIYISYAQIQI